MNWKKFILTYILVLCGSLFTLSAQSILVSGEVKDASGAPIVGATIILEGTTVGTVTDMEGYYQIDVDGVNDPALVLTYIGYRTERAEVASRSVVNFTVEEDTNLIDELVVVGYGVQKKVSITGAVTSIKTEDLATSASASLATALTGRMPGLVIVQSNGTASNGASTISIRGSSSTPLILVDGVERDFEDIDMDEVEDISILKDASATAVYGIRGGNGVMIITTKRGQEGKFKINYKGEFAVTQAGEFPTALNSYDYARLMNEGARNDAGVALDDTSFTGDIFSAQDLSFYKSGIAPVTHPDTDYADFLLNDFGWRQKHGVTISGGNDFIKSFTSLSYMKERDVYADWSDLVGYDDRSTYSRYNVRTNLDINISKTTLFSVDLGGQFTDRHRPNVTLSSLTGDLFDYPSTESYFDSANGRVVMIGSENESNNPIYNRYDQGYVDVYNNKLQFAAKLNQNLNFITKGLQFNASISYDHSYSNTYTASRSDRPTYYLGFIDDSDGSIVNYLNFVYDDDANILDPNTGEYISQSEMPLLSEGILGRLSASRSTTTSTKTVNFKSVLSYNRAFKKHNVSALGVFTTNVKSYHSSSDVYVPIKFMEAAMRATYNYDHKYFVEFNGGYNGSEAFAPANRFGFFPAVSAGWVASSEKFFPKNDVFTFLKFRASYGTTGIDTTPNRFMYYDEWTLNYTGGYYFGYTATQYGTAYQTTSANLTAAWATNYQQNYGIETSWFKDKLKINADIFHYDKKGIMIEPNTVAGIVAGTLVAENMKWQTMDGYEIQASYNGKIGAVKFNVFANYNYANTINKFIDEVEPEYEWMALTGKNPNQILALDCVGFYTQEEIDILNTSIADTGKGTTNIPSTEYGSVALQAGDLKYRDLNEDGIINDYDMMYMEDTSVPKTTFGFGGGFQWKNFSMNLFFQGASDVTYIRSGQLCNPFQNEKTTATSYLVYRWTQERYDAGETILYPRVSSSTSISDHNYQSSNFWMHDASYIRLKNVEMSYNIKSDQLASVGINNLKLTLSGTNLFTWTGLEFVDPEMQSGESVAVGPSKVYTLGVGIQF